MSGRGALLDALLAEPSKAATLPRDVAASLLIEMAPVQRALELALMLSSQATPVSERHAEMAPRLLTMSEVAERARKSPRWVADHWRTEMPFAVRKGRTVLFPEPEFERWLKRP